MIAAWTLLRDLANQQAGHFNSSQATEVGVYPQLISNAMKSGRIERVFRGVYRFLDLPHDDMAEYASVWLWTEQDAVISHSTALYLHGLGDALPSKIHVSLPSSWKRRISRRATPALLRPHFQTIETSDVVWHDCVPITSVRKSIIDCARDDGLTDTIEGAVKEAIHRGLLELADARVALNELYSEKAPR